MVKTQAGTVELHCQWSRQDFQQPLIEAVQSLRGGEGFHRLGFSLPNMHGLVDEELEEEDYMAGRMFCIALVNMKLTTLLPYCWGLPGYFVALRDPRPSCVQIALGKLKFWWDLLLAAERLCDTSTLSEIRCNPQSGQSGLGSRRS